MTYRRQKPKFTRLRMAHYFSEVDSLVRQGFTGTMIARMLHERGDAEDLSEGRLSAEINAYRRSLSAMELVEAMKPRFVHEAEKQIIATLDEAKELAELYAIQRERIVTLHKAEKDNQTHNRLLSNEVRVAAEVLRTSHQIKVEVGVHREDGSRTDVKVDVETRYGDGVSRVMLDPRSRQRIVDALRQVRSSVTGEVVPFPKAAG